MTWTISYRDHEAGATAVALDWDTVQDASLPGLVFDWALAPQDGRADSGGLVSRAAIATAVILSLFTDARAPDGWRPEVQDRRGWWGDGLADARTEPFGSWLWTVLEQSVATEATARDAAAEARRALAWMIRDGVAGAVDVEATATPSERRLSLRIRVTAPSGALLHDRSYDIL